MAVKVPVMQSKCGCCPSCEASAGSLRDVVVGADIFIGASEAVMDRVAAELRNVGYMVSQRLEPAYPRGCAHGHYRCHHC